MKKQKLTRAIVVAVTVALLFGVLPIQAFASSNLDRRGSSIAEYQEILDRLNREYGTEWRFVTQEDVDWAHARAIELWGYLPEGGPKVTTLGELRQCTLREYEAISRGECLEAVARQQEQERLNRQY